MKRIEAGNMTKFLQSLCISFRALPPVALTSQLVNMACQMLKDTCVCPGVKNRKCVCLK